MEFRILGPLEVVDEAPVGLPPGRQRALLASLVLRAGEVVPVDRLIEDLWPDEPPATATKVIQVYVSELRKAFDPYRRVLLTHAPGYRLAVDADAIDALRFEQLAAAGREHLARGEHVLAADTLREALSLWRGEALAEFAYEQFAQGAITRLEEQRLAALEDRVEADLALGRHVELVGELEALVGQHPLRERLRAALMVALYRAGRQAEALEVYRTARTTLADELGLEPGEALRELEGAILRRDAALDLTAEERPVREEPRAPARKPVTAVFADLAATGDPEAVRTRLAATGDAIAAELERHDAHVERPVADTVIGAFGVVEVREDDALRALRAATAVAALDGDAVHVRVAVGTGETVVDGGADVVGLRPDVTVPPGAVVVSAATASVIRGVAELAEHEDGTWLLVGLPEDAEPIVRRGDAPFVGREAELRRIRDVYERARDQRACNLVTVVGPAGIGKSRLAAELSESIAGEALVLVARCRPYGEGPTYEPLRALLAGLDETVLRGALAGEPDAEVILERIAAASEESEAATAGPETFWAVRKLFEGLALERPLVAVVDDVQWAQPTMLSLLEHIAAWSREAPIMLLCLARPDLLEQRPTWGAGNVEAATMRLEPLSDEQSARLIDHLREGTEVDADAVARVATAAEGNPLFIEQMLALLEDAGAAPAAMPPTIHALLAARLDRLVPAERELLAAASVAGRDFDRGALATIAEPDDLTLDSLVRKDLLRATSDGFRFRHALVRDAAYASLPKRRRAALHERFADAGAEGDEVVGHHLGQASVLLREVGDDPGPLALRAAERLAAAGRRASARGDIPAASALMRRAAELLPQDSAVRLDLLPELAQVARSVGDFAEASALVDEALASGDERVVWRARNERLRVRLRVEKDVHADELLGESDEVIGALERLGDARELADAWQVRSWIPWLLCRAAETEEAAYKSIEYARRAGDETMEARNVMNLLGAALFGPRPVADGLAFAAEVLERAEPHTTLEAIASRAEAGLAAMAGDFARARSATARERAILADLGQTISDAHGAEVRGLIELLAGDPAAAERELREGYEVIVALDVSSPTFAAILARAVELQGRDDEALELTAVSRDNAGVEDLTTQVQWRGPRARVLARRGERVEAEQLAREAVELAARTDFLSLHADALMDLAVVVKDDNAAREARELYERKGNIAALARLTAR